MAHLSDLLSRRDLWANLTLRELRGKYRGSVIGWGWSLLNPLATMAIFAVVFRVFLKIEPPRGEPSGLKFFALFLLCGLLPWNFLSNTINGGMGSLLGNANLVKKVWFPREVLVASVTAANLVTFVIELGVLAVALLVVGNMVLPWLPVALLLVVLMTVFATGLALVLSVISVYFRDVPYLVGLSLQVWFYATPIVYPETLVASGLERHPALYDLYRANPTVRFVEGFRDVFYDLRMPDLSTFLICTAWAVGSLGVGWLVFQRFEPRLAEEM